MSPAPRGDGPVRLPRAILERMDEVCTRFEREWQGGSQPDIADFLEGEGPERAALFRELLKLDLEYRLQRGERPAAEAYRRRFPAEAGTAVFESLVLEPGTLGEDPGAGDGPPRWDTGAEGPPARLPGGLSRYRIERVLGQGAFGRVYLAEDQELRRPVALKVAHEEGPLGGQAFLAEARAMASLDHPAIIPVYDVGCSDGRTFIVTKWVNGCDLAERLRQGLPPQRQVALWMAAAARALQAAHETGLVHRDLKPSNILIDAAGAAYVGDFGLALRGENTGKGPRLLGTPAYMSPEQARGQGHLADARSDVFNLGAVLYELLTGRPPFKAESLSKTLLQVLEHDPVSPQRLNPAVARDLDTICLKCLEKSPAKRYPTAGALADDLQRHLDHRVILARPAGSGERLARWARRHPTTAAALATTALAFLTAFALVERARREEFRQRQEAQRLARSERWERYRASIMAAAGTLHLHDASGVRGALDAAPPEYRNWEWRHLSHQLDTADALLPAPGPEGRSRFSADLGRAIFVRDGRPPRLLDLRARDDLGPLALAPPAADFGLSVDGRCLAAPGPDGTFVLWDVPGDRPRARWHASESGLNQWALSPDGARLAVSCQDGTVRVVDTATGRERWRWHDHDGVPGRLAFSPDGARLATCGEADHTVRLRDLTDGRTLAVLRHSGSATWALFSPRGDRLLTAEAYPDTLLRLWDVTTREPVAVLRGHTNEVLAWAFSRDGVRVATAGYDQTVRLWDGATGELQATLRGHKGWVLGLDFSPDRRRLVSTGRDRTLRLWDAATGEQLAVAHTHSEYLAVRYTADGTTVVASGDGPVRLWDARQLECGGVLRGHAKSVYDLAFHPDGRRVASASWDGTVRLWDATTGDALGVLRYPDRTIVVGVAVHPGGELLASAGRDDCVRLWDLDRGRQVGRLPLPTAKNWDSRVAFSPRGDLLACGCRDDRALHLWRLPLRPPVASGHIEATEVAVLRGAGRVNAVAFGRDGHWVAVGEQGRPGRVRVWPIPGGGPARVLEGHAADVHALAVSRDGRWLASGSADGTVRLWDTADWTEAGVLRQGSQVYGVAFSPDGSRLACACADASIHLWDTATRQFVCGLEGHGQFVHQVAFSPDGSRLASASGDDTVRVWDTLSHADRVAAERR